MDLQDTRISVLLRRTISPNNTTTKNIDDRYVSKIN